MSEINVSIIDQKTLRLEEDAKKGDVINLDKITSIDNSYLLSLIEKEKNTHINKLIQDAIKNKENELKALYNEELNNKEIHIQSLKKDIESINSTFESNIKIKENEIKSSLKDEYDELLRNKEEENIKIKEELNLIKNSESQKIENAKLALRLDIEKEIMIKLFSVDFIDVNFLKENYADSFRSYLNHDLNISNVDIINHIGKTRVALLKDGKVNFEGAIRLLLNDFKEAKIAKVTLDKLC